MTMRDGRLPPVVVVLLAAASFVVFVAGLKGAAGILVPVLVSAFVVVIVAPLFFLMQRKGVPAPAALLVLIFGLVALGFGTGMLINRSIREFTAGLPDLEAKVAAETAHAEVWLEERGIQVPDEGLVEALSPVNLLQFTGSLVAAMGGVLGNLLLILLLSIFMLLEAAILPAKLREAADFSEATWSRVAGMVDGIRRYVVLKAGLSALTGALVGVLLLVFDVPFVLLLAWLAFVLNFIPTIGSVVAAVPGVVLALVQHGLGTAVMVALFYVAINVGVSNIVEPRVLGRGLGLSPLVIVLALVFWGWVFGPIGMLLAIPLTMVVKIALESTEETAWISVVLGGRPPAASEE